MTITQNHTLNEGGQRMETNKTKRKTSNKLGLKGPQIEELLNLFQPLQLTGWFVYLLYCDKQLR